MQLLRFDNAPYHEVWQHQERLRQQLLSDIQESQKLIILTHKPTITLGRAEKGDNLLVGQSILEKEGIDLVLTNRGGKITYHGPGQLIVYPIVHLKKLQLGVKQFVCLLEKTIIDVLAHFDIKAARKDGLIGVWCENRKIASVGIHVSKQVCIHGLALNVCPNMDHFLYITPCGIAGVEMTSMSKELKRDVKLDEVYPVLIKMFEHHFKVSIHE